MKLVKRIQDLYQQIGETNRDKELHQKTKDFKNGRLQHRIEIYKQKQSKFKRNQYQMVEFYLKIVQ